jgi:hypothetical protein
MLKEVLQCPAVVARKRVSGRARWAASIRRPLGVVCTDDRLDRRIRMPFPDFLCALDRSLLEELSADPGA